uniref:Uncharacterized protein n=1 Tax=Arundo donax TaxID=35708 RepID=A0A0A8ZVS7_ARUDO
MNKAWLFGPILLYSHVMTSMLILLACIAGSFLVFKLT